MKFFPQVLQFRNTSRLQNPSDGRPIGAKPCPNARTAKRIQIAVLGLSVFRKKGGFWKSRQCLSTSRLQFCSVADSRCVQNVKEQ